MTLGIGRRRRARLGSKAITCPYCGKALRAAHEAVSIQCGRCNNRVELEDLEVFENISRDLMTGASVLVRGEATVHGNIHAAEVIVCGLVKGNIKATMRARLTRGARIVGNIEAPVIDVEDGAKVTGRLEIKPNTSSRR